MRQAGETRGRGWGGFLHGTPSLLFVHRALGENTYAQINFCANN
jgi:hypothetical protein